MRSSGNIRGIIWGSHTQEGKDREREREGRGYECKANVYASCSAWEPGGVEPWDLVWTILGSCEGQLDPTNEPTVGPTTASPTWNLGGCPPFWVGGDEYNGGEFVSYNNDEEGNEDEESTNKRE